MKSFKQHLLNERESGAPTNARGISAEYGFQTALQQYGGAYHHAVNSGMTHDQALDHAAKTWSTSRIGICRLEC